jgi:hypothetical protein
MTDRLGLDVEKDRQVRIDVVTAWWDALMSADMVAFRSMLAPDAVIHYPGQNPLSGTYATTDDIVDLYTTLTRFVTEGTFTGELLDITTGSEYTTMILKYQLHLPIKTLDGRATGLFLLDENYQVKEYWLHEWNQVMINRVLRATRVSQLAAKPFVGIVNMFTKKGEKK